MITNPYHTQFERSKYVRFGTPSWLAAVRFYVYRAFHRDVYRPYERHYDE